MIRISPGNLFQENEYMPCSIVALSCATKIHPEWFYDRYRGHIRKDGYMSLNNMKKMVKDYYRVVKSVYLENGKRVALKDFKFEPSKQYIVCVLGHYIYLSTKTKDLTYYSYFNNEDDDVIEVWEIERS